MSHLEAAPRKRRQSGKLPNNLPQLQNLIKRDAELYRDEFLQQFDHFRSQLDLFKVTPSVYSKEFDEISNFMGHVSHCYKNEGLKFGAEVMDVLLTSGSVLDQKQRVSLCQILILMRRKDLINLVKLVPLFIKLCHIQDKLLRNTLIAFVVNDVKHLNKTHKNHKVNNELQSYFNDILTSWNPKLNKTILTILIRLYQSNVWKDARTVNMICELCLCNEVDISSRAIQFMLGSDEDEAEKDKDSDGESEESADEDPVASAAGKKSKKTDKQLYNSMKTNKKSKKMENKLTKMKRLMKKKKKSYKREFFNTYSLDLIYNAQDFGDRLFKKLDASRDPYQFKLLLILLLARVIGTQKLLIIQFYSFLQRYLHPHQTEVTKILVALAQATHEQVPPDILEPTVRTLANNFITERNSSEVIAVGINSIREICARNSFCISQDLLQDLLEYKNYRDSAVQTASRSMLQLFRQINPHMLKNKQKGKPTEASVQQLAVMGKAGPQYGQTVATDHLSGADFLFNKLKQKKQDGDDDNDDEEWEDVEDDMEDSDEYEYDTLDEDEEAANEAESEEENEAEEKITTIVDDKIAKAKAVTEQRILTQSDFERLKERQLEMAVSASRTKHAKAAAQAASQNSAAPSSRLPGILDIAWIDKKKKRAEMREQFAADAAERRATKQKFGQSKGRASGQTIVTNKEKTKCKAFGMIKHKVRREKHTKRSFRDKQEALKQSLIKAVKNRKK